MPIIIENETHWRTPDIRNLVSAAQRGGHGDTTRRVEVSVIYHILKVANRRPGGKRRTHHKVMQSDIDYTFKRGTKATKIVIRLPKAGPRVPHPVAMVAVAAASAAPTDSELLAPSETFWLANNLAILFWDSDRYAGSWPMELDKTMQASWGSRQPPFWSKPGEALICKVKDPTKDGTYLDFVAKKNAALGRAKTAIEKELRLIEAAKRRLKKAQDRKKTIEKSLASARARRK